VGEHAGLDFGGLLRQLRDEVASRAWAIFSDGMAIDPEQSTMMISAAPAAAAGLSAVEQADVTDTMALTSRTPAGRYSFWKTSTVNSDTPIAACSYGSLGITSGGVGLATGN
jgi:hypothetical protein